MPRLALVELGSLVPHEEVEPDRVRRLIAGIRRSGVIKPIIVEASSGVIVDGHHRVEAARRLGLRLIPAYLARYGAEIADTGSWTYVARYSPGLARHVIGLVEELDQLVKRGSARLIVRAGDEVIGVSVDALDFYMALRDHPNLLTRFKKVADPSNCSGNICIHPPRLSPWDIRLAALRGPLPPRTTNHVTPLKRTRLFIPLRGL